MIRFTASAVILFATTFVNAQMPTFNDVVYATGVPITTLGSGGTGVSTINLKMDIYKATNTTANTPVLLSIHGGGWSTGSYNAVPAELLPVLARGVSIVSIQYRLSQEASFTAQIHDVKGALRFLRANGDTYGLDTTRVAAWGHSAGGHLSALLGTSAGVASLEGTIGGNLGQSSRISAVVDAFGPTDILNMNLDVTAPPGSIIDHDASNSPESRLIGFSGTGQGIGVLRANQSDPALAVYLDRAINANPITHVTSDDASFFILHGNNDTSVPQMQSIKLRNALQSANVPVTYTAFNGGHGAYGDALSLSAQDFVVTQLVPVPEPSSIILAILVSAYFFRRFLMPAK